MSDQKTRIGYCSPPLETRFKKGVSGNPKGRPRKAACIGQDGDEVTQLLFGKNKLTVGGRSLDVRRVDILLREQYKSALKGNHRMALELLRLHRDLQRRQRPNAQKQWLTLPPVLEIPGSVHDSEIVPWDKLYDDAKRAGLVPADRAGHWLVDPSWLKRALREQGKAAPQPKKRPMDAAIERAFKTRVTAKKGGVDLKVPLAKALYLVVIDAASERPSVMKSLNKMAEEAHTVAVGDEDAEDGTPGGCLIVPEAPATIEEWMRLYGDKANGAYGCRLRAEYEASRR